MMQVSVVAVLLLAIGYTYAWQNQYEIYQENVTVDYMNSSFLDLTASIHKFNQTTNHLRFTFTLKKPIPPDTKVSVKGLRWMNNDYRLGIFQLERTITKALEMETFDINRLCVEYTRPAIVWPIRTGVTYRSMGWSPDSSKYPPNAPAGKWKVLISGTCGNNIKILEASWYLHLIYKA